MPHQNRSKRTKSPSANPEPEEIRAARLAANLTQTEAARLVHATLQAWQQWEAPKDELMHRRMHLAFWELFRIKVASQQ